MATPMTTHIRKVRDSDSDLVDMSLYRQLIGSLMYLVNTRLDIFFVVKNISHFQVEPRHEHWIDANHVPCRTMFLPGMVFVFPKHFLPPTCMPTKG
jgi:hypothetical protein